MVRCETELSSDVIGLFNNLTLENEHWHRNNNEDYLFSFNIKECRLESLFSALEKLQTVKTKDSVLEEWYDIEVDITMRFDSDQARIDHIEILNGKMNHLQNITQQHPLDG